jgi:hypothetical protein
MQLEGRHPGEFLMTEANGSRSRESLVIAPEQEIEANSILASQADPSVVTAATSAGAGNTGNATIAIGDPAVSTAVRPGRYRGIATDATHVAWEDAAGHYIGESVHGTPFTAEIALTITAGDTPNVVGDEFSVDVTGAADAWQHVPFDPDSDAPIAGITIYPATTGTGETTKIAAIVRKAEVNRNTIAWPDGIIADQRTLATQALAARGIIVR